MNRTYTLNLEQVVPPNLNGNVTFYIDNYNRSFKLKSISFDLSIINNANNFLLPLEQNTTQAFSLGIFALPVPTQFAQIFEDIVETIAGSVAYNGSNFKIYRPGQRIFNSFFINQRLNFIFAYANLDPLLTYLYNATIIVETEDIGLIK
jgi:hypothetical protein